MLIYDNGEYREMTSEEIALIDRISQENPPSDDAPTEYDYAEIGHILLGER